MGLSRLAVPLGLALFAAPAASQTARPGKLVRASMSVSMPTRSAANVRIRYVVRPPAAPGAVPVTAVLFAPAALENVEAVFGERSSAVALTPGEGHGAAKLTGAIALPPGAADTIAFEIRYTVTPAGPTAGDSRVRLPVVAVMWPPADALPGTFVIALDVAADAHIRGAFPSLLRETSATAAARTYEADMQVLPSMIAFDIGTGDPPRVTLEAMLDTGVLALLLLFAILGWRHLRAQQR